MLSPEGLAHAEKGRAHGYPFEPDPSDPRMFVKSQVDSLFHGTDADLPIGSRLDLSGKMNYLRSLGHEPQEEPEGTFGGHRLWLTSNPHWAGAHGRNIYQVTPSGLVRNTYGDNFATNLPLTVVHRYGTGDRSLLTQ